MGFHPNGPVKDVLDAFLTAQIGAVVDGRRNRDAWADEPPNLEALPSWHNAGLFFQRLLRKYQCALEQAVVPPIQRDEHREMEADLQCCAPFPCHLQSPLNVIRKGQPNPAPLSLSQHAALRFTQFIGQSVKHLRDRK